jgi:hypothetical protein
MGQLPEGIWKALQGIIDFVSISATVCSPPKHASSPLSITLAIQLIAEQPASWQQTMDGVCEAAKSVREQFSEVLFPPTAHLHSHLCTDICAEMNYAQLLGHLYICVGALISYPCSSLDM